MEKRIERITLLHRSLKAARFGKTIEDLVDEIGVSRATIYRDLDFLKASLGAPIDTVDGRHRYSRNEAASFELPGLWLSAEEMYALVLTQQIVQGEQDQSAEIDEDQTVLGASLGAAHARMAQILGDKATNLRRLRVLRHNSRRVNERVFRIVAAATLERKTLRFGYRARSTDEDTVRTVHPQRLIHYRDNWYLDALDETRSALRSFALDRISDIQLQDASAQDMPDAELDAALSSGYGIFKGVAKHNATIRFSAHASRWAAEEIWHPEQVGTFLSDASYELNLPYSNGRELLMDVLRYGPDAEIIAPVALREQMRSLLTLTSENYGLT